MLYHYARNWRVPSGGEYALRLRVEPPAFMRHDRVNGRRSTEPVEVEPTGVKVERGQDWVHIAWASVLGIPSLLAVEA